MAFLKNVYLWVGTFILILGVILSFFLPKFIHGDVPQDVNIYIIYYIYLVNTVISYFFAGYKSALLTANQRSDLVSKVSTATSVTQYFIQGVVLLMFKNYYAYILILPLSTLAINICNAYLSKKYYPQYFAKGRLNSNELKPMKKQIGGLLISRICAVSRNAVANILISSFIGLVPLAIYSNYLYIETSVHGLLTIVGASIVAGVGNSIIKETESKNYQDFKKFNFMYMWVVGWVFCGFVALFQPFITLWLGAESTMPFPTVVLLCLVFYFTAAGDMRNTYINATGIWWQNRWRPVIEAVINVVLCLILIRQFQIAGVLLSILLTMVFVNLWYGSKVLYTEYFKSQKFSNFILWHVLYFIVTLIVASFTYMCCEFITLESSPALILRFIICIILPNLLFMLFYHRKTEYKEFVLLIRGIILRNKK